MESYLIPEQDNDAVMLKVILYPLMPTICNPLLTALNLRVLTTLGICNSCNIGFCIMSFPQHFGFWEHTFPVYFLYSLIGTFLSSHIEEDKFDDS